MTDYTHVGAERSDSALGVADATANPDRATLLVARLAVRMGEWLWYGVAAAVLYGLHQVFTKLAAPHIGSGPGALVVEASAAAVVGLFLGYSRWVARQPQVVSATGVWYSLLTGLCVGVGTITFFLLFQRGGPLSAVPAILAGGAAIMAAVGMVFLGESTSWPRILGVLLAIVSLVLLNAGAPK